MKKIISFSVCPFTNRKHGIFVSKTKDSNGKIITYQEAERLIRKYPDKYIVENKENYDNAADQIGR